MHSIPSVKKRIRLKANNGKVNIVLKANTSLSAFAVASFHCVAQTCASSPQYDFRRHRAMENCDSGARTAFQSTARTSSVCVLARAPLKNRHKTTMEYYEMPRAGANQMPIDFNAS